MHEKGVSMHFRVPLVGWLLELALRAAPGGCAARPGRFLLPAVHDRAVGWHARADDPGVVRPTPGAPSTAEESEGQRTVAQRQGT